MPPVTIRILGINGANSWSPNPATLQVGQEVRWRNVDPALPHKANGAGFDTGILAPGQTSAPFTFSSPGQINYECGIHPGQMSGGMLNITQ